ncbi:MAG: hypothetical protein Q8L26_04180 [Candidatus Omnitrophota bacterium]|nr:hypothetical protein [Candidatus Omnitrophota bacterium]
MRKKFVRKPKAEPKQEEPLLMPEEYNPEFNKDVLYKDYLVYWRSWHDELIASLEANLSHKKQVDCAQEAIVNLGKLRGLLNEEKQKVLDVYLEELKALRDDIKEGASGANLSIIKHKLTINRRNILHNFMYSKVKEDLK